MQDFYRFSPIIMQNIACSLHGFQLSRKRFGGNFAARFAEVCQRLNETNEYFEIYRNKKLKDFISHSYNTTIYYRQLFDDCGIPPSQIQSIEDLKMLPILTKETVKDKYHEFVSSNPKSKKLIATGTSGTTGSGLPFNTTIEAYREQWLIWWRFRKQHGIRIGEWCAFFGGKAIVPIDQKTPPFWRVNWPGAEIRFSVYHMTSENIDSYIDKISKSGVRWIHGNPSSITLLAVRVIETNRQNKLNIRWVSIGAENLSDYQKGVMTEAFGTAPIQHYGLAEAVANISECRHGNFCVDEDFSAVEFVQTSIKTQQSLIGTNFSNYAFPLIRYDSGDLVTACEPGQQNCGCLGRRVESIDGRSDDYLTLANGAKTTRVDFILKQSLNVKQAQFIQTVPGQANLLIVRGERFSQCDEKVITQNANKLLGRHFLLKIRYVKSIEKSKSGKAVFINNLIR